MHAGKKSGVASPVFREISHCADRCSHGEINFGTLESLVIPPFMKGLLAASLAYLRHNSHIFIPYGFLDAIDNLWTQYYVGWPPAMQNLLPCSNVDVPWARMSRIIVKTTTLQKSFDLACLESRHLPSIYETMVVIWKINPALDRLQSVEQNFHFLFKVFSPGSASACDFTEHSPYVAIALSIWPQDLQHTCQIRKSVEIKHRFQFLEVW